MVVVKGCFLDPLLSRSQTHGHACCLGVPPAVPPSLPPSLVGREGTWAAGCFPAFQLLSTWLRRSSWESCMSFDADRMYNVCEMPVNKFRKISSLCAWHPVVSSSPLLFSVNDASPYSLQDHTPHSLVSPFPSLFFVLSGARFSPKVVDFFWEWS